MATVTLHQAESNLSALIHALKPGEEVIITENNRPVAKLTIPSASTQKPRQKGSAKGKLIIHSEDEEHLSDFGAYMP